MIKNKAANAFENCMGADGSVARGGCIAYFPSGLFPARSQRDTGAHRVEDGTWRSA